MSAPGAVALSRPITIPVSDTLPWLIGAMGFRLPIRHLLSFPCH